MRSRWELERVPIPFLVFASLFFMVVPAPAQAPSVPLPDRPLRLADCLALSEQRQPSLMVARARLAAAQSRLASLEAMRGGPLRRDLPMRRQQARLGVTAAQADLARLKPRLAMSSPAPISRCCTAASSER